MRRSLMLAVVLLVVAAALVKPSIVGAQSDQALSMDVHPGLDGFCKYDTWLPVRVTLQNDGPDIDGSLAVVFSEGQQEWRYNSDVDLPAVSRKEITLYGFPPGRQNEVLVQLWEGNNLLLEQAAGLTCLPEEDFIYGVWAANPSIFNTLTAIEPPNGRATLAQLESTDFPTHFQGFSALTALAISDVDTGVLSPAQLEALELWIANGGQLIVAGGPAWQKTAAGLKDLLPLAPSGTVTLEGLPDLQSLIQSPQPLDGQAVVANGELHPEGVVLVSENGLPLVTERKIGFGKVLYLAADPALVPLRNWDGMEGLYQLILDTPVDTPAWADGFGEWGDAANALANIPGLSLPPVWLICGFLILYVILIGPVNYFVLRALKIREMAWISIPIFTIVFTAAAFLIGFQIRGTRPIVSQLSLVEVWPGQEYAVSHGLVGVFSPQRRTYRFEMGNDALAHPIPPTGFGGSPLEDWFVSQLDSGFEIPELRVDVGGIQGTVTSASLPAPQFSQSLTFGTVGSQILAIQGEVTNLSDLSLEDVYFLGPSNAQSIGSLNPGQTIPVNLTFLQSGNATPQNSNSQITTPGLDPTLRDIFGTTSAYSLNDAAEVQRFFMLRSALNSGSRGNGFYLLGWSDDPLNEANLVNERANQTFNTLYIVHLQASVDEIDGQIKIPPALFNWSVLEDTTLGGTVSPYDVYTSPGAGAYSLRFSLNQPIQFNEVNELSLNLASYNTQGPVPYRVFLWNFELDEWVQLDGPSWGIVQISNPGEYVSDSAEIRLKIENTNANDRIVIERSDFDLVVTR